MLLTNHSVLGEILEPQFFADRNPKICPQFPHPKPPFSISEERQSGMFESLLQYSFLFVMLLEFAHQVNGDVDVTRQTKNAEPVSNWKRREKAADDYALEFLVEQKSNPLLALPIIFLIANLQDFQVKDDPSDEHPSTLSRMQDKFEFSEKILKSRKFKKWLKQQDPHGIQTSEQFVKFMQSTF